MRTRTKVTAFLLLIVTCATLAVVASRPAEPAYGGHPLSFWLNQYDSRINTPEDFPASPEFQRRTQAREAIRKIGTNAVPFLLNRLNYEPPKYYKAVYDNVTRVPGPPWLPSLVDTLCGNQFRRSHEASVAVRGFDALGTNAIAAIPDLAVISTNYTRPSASSLATSALGYLGIRALPILLWARSNCPPWQLESVNAGLAYRLVPSLDNSEAVPFLLRAIVDKNENLRWAATKALARIAPDLLTNTPAK